MLEDFRNHLWACFKYLGIGEPTPAQYAMAEALQHFGTDMQLQAGRGFGKSVITSCLASWFLLKNPNTTIMVVSATSNKAAEFISMTRRILDLVPYCEHLRPGDHTSDNAFAFNVECRTKIGQDKSCFARGITSQLTGSHADYVIADDVEIEGNCETAAARDKLMNKISEFEQIRNVGGRVIFLGTPQIKDSIYNQLKDGYKVTKFPAVMPAKNEVDLEDVNEFLLKGGFEEGDPIQPERFPMELLMERQAKIGPKLFALHYKLDTSLADFEKFPLRLSDLVVIDVDPNICPEKIVWANSVKMKGMPNHGLSGDFIYEPMWVSNNYIEYTQRVLCVDPSGRGDDETAVCIGSFSNGYIYIHELLGYPGGYETNILKKIAKLAREYRVSQVKVEANFGDGMFTQLLRPIIFDICGPIALDEYKVSGRKETRIINALEPVMSQHRLVLDRRVAAQEENQKQITRIFDKRGALPHDDRIDCLSAVVTHWENLLSIDVDEVIHTNKQREYQQMVASWADDDRRGNLVIGSTSGAARMVRPEPKKPYDMNRSKWTGYRRTRNRF